ncbi:MAG TPA: hypothetical protein VGM03_03440 [Phycisphaerae bacterium]|jgi:hypothetical protein
MIQAQPDFPGPFSRRMGSYDPSTGILTWQSTEYRWEGPGSGPGCGIVVVGPPACLVNGSMPAPPGRPVAHAFSPTFSDLDVGLGLGGDSSCDPEGAPLTYSWVQVAGASGVLSDANSARATFVARRVGVYAFELTVNDGVDTSAPARTATRLYDIDLTTDPPAGAPVAVGVETTISFAVQYSGICDGGALYAQFGTVNAGDHSGLEGVGLPLENRLGPEVELPAFAGDVAVIAQTPAPDGNVTGAVRFVLPGEAAGRGDLCLYAYIQCPFSADYDPIDVPVPFIRPIRLVVFNSPRYPIATGP